MFRTLVYKHLKKLGVYLQISVDCGVCHEECSDLVRNIHYRNQYQLKTRTHK